MNFIKSLKLIFIFLFVLTVSKTKAQDILKPKFGLRAGASFSTMFGGRLEVYILCVVMIGLEVWRFAKFGRLNV